MTHTVKHNMKGITPVISLILLLVIVIVVVGFSFGIFQNLIAGAGEAATTQTTTTTQNIQQTARYEACNPGAAGIATITMRNMGSGPMNGTAIGVYVNGASVTCGATWPDTLIPAGGVKTCTSSAAIASGATIRITSPSGASETQTC